MDDTTTAVAAALDRVGPRLKQLRAHRGVTLSALSEATGISKSSLSRLENGQRRASLELLLLAQAYRVPLDDLVGAPEVGDPPHPAQGEQGQRPECPTADPVPRRDAGVEDHRPGE